MSQNVSPAAVVISALRVNVLSSSAIISLKRSWLLYFNCLIDAMWLLMFRIFLAPPWVCLQRIIVAFPGHTHLPFVSQIIQTIDIICRSGSYRISVHVRNVFSSKHTLHDQVKCNILFYQLPLILTAFLHVA